jgi:hypothetical protein
MNIPDLIAKLQDYETALGDGRDLTTDRAKSNHYATKMTVARTLSGLKNLPADLAREQQHLADLEARRAVVVAKHEDVERELEAATSVDFDAITDLRELDKAYDLVGQMKLRLRHLRAGALVQAPGVFFERLDTLDTLIAEQTRRRDGVQSHLDACVVQAEALLAVAV